MHKRMRMKINKCNLKPLYVDFNNTNITPNQQWTSLTLKGRNVSIILNVLIDQFRNFGHYRPRSMLFRVPLPSCSTICSVQNWPMRTFKITSLHRVKSVRTCSGYTKKIQNWPMKTFKITNLHRVSEYPACYISQFSHVSLLKIG
jgi:hypothetical protein